MRRGVDATEATEATEATGEARCARFPRPARPRAKRHAGGATRLCARSASWTNAVPALAGRTEMDIEMDEIPTAAAQPSQDEVCVPLVPLRARFASLPRSAHVARVPARDSDAPMLR